MGTPLVVVERESGDATLVGGGQYSGSAAALWRMRSGSVLSSSHDSFEITIEPCQGALNLVSRLCFMIPYSL